MHHGSTPLNRGSHVPRTALPQSRRLPALHRVRLDVLFHGGHQPARSRGRRVFHVAIQYGPGVRARAPHTTDHHGPARGGSSTRVSDVAGTRARREACARTKTHFAHGTHMSSGSWSGCGGGGVYVYGSSLDLDCACGWRRGCPWGGARSGASGCQCAVQWLVRHERRQQHAQRHGASSLPYLHI